MITVSPIKLNSYKNISFLSNKNEINKDIKSSTYELTDVQFKSVIPKKNIFSKIINKISKFVKDFVKTPPSYEDFDIQDEIFRVLA
ncbi:MAG TPA: hypothetical protein PLG15_02540 [Candidatus Gastranaerophilaceae bacterium]|nr:hypothetical protein [Candidatus Gastranaerophilaceae bacterium]HPT41242.1 hypothetical protein [Candidatus Gastranaerophilaceae bacterium]